MTADDRQTVAVLLAKARRAAKGAVEARLDGNALETARLEAKARAKRDEAEALDPAHNDPAWGCDQ